MRKILGPFIVILTAGLATLFADPGPGKLLVILGIAVSLGGPSGDGKTGKVLLVSLRGEVSWDERCPTRLKGTR
jgi:hypothetical protein